MTELAVTRISRREHTTIEPASRWVPLELREVWRFRELLVTLAGRDVRLRYRQTALGVAWVVIQPLMAAGVFSLVFGRIAKLGSDGLPYFLSAFAGMLGWNAFQTTLTKSGSCLLGNSHLVSKVYFPRIVLPLSSIFTALIDFAVAFVMFLILLIIYHHPPSIQLLLLPVWLVLILGLALGVGLFVGGLTVSYRDVQYIMPVMVQFLMFASPIAYSVSNISKLSPRMQSLYFLNPLAGYLAAFRWSLLGVGTVPWGYVGYSVVVTVVLLVSGAYSFRHMEQRFADVI
ncbi:MAG TPA: ABC transporter permease [Tepidisphaeraceae bacterium]|nr:ABC transporter permease [Tepidisphaeraceae bacterium]